MQDAKFLPARGEEDQPQAGGGASLLGQRVAEQPLHPSAAPSGPPPQRAGEELAAAAITLSGLAGILFGWSPDTFWNATPAELAALVRAARGGGEPAAPVDLTALMERYPDE